MGVENPGMQEQVPTDRVTADQDDVLGAIPLVAGHKDLEDRLYDQLVDLLVEGMFLELARDDATDEMADLAARCYRLGLLPLPSRRSVFGVPRPRRP